MNSVFGWNLDWIKCLLYKNRVQGAIINVYNKILQANLKKKYENELRINFTVFVAS